MRGIGSKIMSDALLKITPVILAGGAGTRLRPLTSETRPKPFLKLFGAQSLLQDTALRVYGDGFGPPVVVTSKNYGEHVLRGLDDIGIRPRSIILEPASRSTAPAIAQAAVSMAADDLLLVMPSDHYIDDVVAFQNTVKAAADVAMSQDIPVLLGVRPARPSRRYGYIECDADGRVLGFFEKPDMRDAKSLFHKDNMFWNTGVFVVKASALLSLFQEFALEIHDCAVAAHEKSMRSGVFYEPDFFEFVKAPSISIDYSIMERVSFARLLIFDGYWSDVGCWGSFVKTKMRHVVR